MFWTLVMFGLWSASAWSDFRKLVKGEGSPGFNLFWLAVGLFFIWSSGSKLLEACSG